MMHPQDYTNSDGLIDAEFYNKYYITMLKNLSEMEVVFVTFEDLIKYGFPGS